jgi:hypothetical protein
MGTRRKMAVPVEPSLTIADYTKEALIEELNELRKHGLGK